nr:terminase small subunit [uncultured Kingella sp.]
MEKQPKPIQKQAGRPSSFTQQHFDGAEWYLKGGFQERGEAVPSIAGLVCLLGAARNQIRDWGRQHEHFGDLLEAIKAKQENLLINKGLQSDFNPTITKLMLANHGYSDKTENAVSGSLEVKKSAADLTDEELAEELAKYGIKQP